MISFCSVCVKYAGGVFSWDQIMNRKTEQNWWIERNSFNYKEMMVHVILTEIWKKKKKISDKNQSRKIVIVARHACVYDSTRYLGFITTTVYIYNIPTDIFSYPEQRIL